MRKIIGILVAALLSTSASAETSDLVTGNNNVIFNQFIRSKGLPSCLPNTYSATLSNDDYGEPWSLSQSDSFGIFEAAWTKESKVIKRIQEGNSLTLHLEMPGEMQFVVKEVYADGYAVIQACPTKFL